MVLPEITWPGRADHSPEPNKPEVFCPEEPPWIDESFHPTGLLMLTFNNYLRPTMCFTLWETMK